MPTGYLLPPLYPDDFLSLKPFCDKSAGNYYKVPTTCFEARDPTTKSDLEVAVLYAEGTHKIADQLYPKEMHSMMEAFMGYDEPLYPIPVGASVYYFVLIAWVTTFYFTYLGRKFLAEMKQKLDLHPEANKFPNLPIYWLQQSKREAEQRREVRNTWAWLARRYLLSPNDPLLANVDQILGTVNWQDFEVSRNTWSLIKCILRMNALFIKVQRNSPYGTKSFEILRDRDLTKVPMEGDKVRRVFEEIGSRSNEKTQAANKVDANLPSQKANNRRQTLDRNSDEQRTFSERDGKADTDATDLHNSRQNKAWKSAGKMVHLKSVKPDTTKSNRKEKSFAIGKNVQGGGSSSSKKKKSIKLPKKGVNEPGTAENNVAQTDNPTEEIMGSNDQQPQEPEKDLVTANENAGVENETTTDEL